MVISFAVLCMYATIVSSAVYDSCNLYGYVNGVYTSCKTEARLAQRGSNSVGTVTKEWVIQQWNYGCGTFRTNFLTCFKAGVTNCSNAERLSSIAGKMGGICNGSNVGSWITEGVLNGFGDLTIACLATSVHVEDGEPVLPNSSYTIDEAAQIWKTVLNQGYPLMKAEIQKTVAADCSWKDYLSYNLISSVLWDANFGLDITDTIKTDLGGSLSAPSKP